MAMMEMLTMRLNKILPSRSDTVALFTAHGVDCKCCSWDVRGLRGKRSQLSMEVWKGAELAYL